MNKTELTQEQKRIKIAEACGWKRGIEGFYFKEGCIAADGLSLHTEDELPDYFNDLNAMHEAEKILHRDQCEQYDNALHEQSSEGEWLSSSWAWNASEAQRAEAFGKALGLW